MSIMSASTSMQLQSADNEAAIGKDRNLPQSPSRLATTPAIQSRVSHKSCTALVSGVGDTGVFASDIRHPAAHLLEASGRLPRATDSLPRATNRLPLIGCH